MQKLMDKLFARYGQKAMLGERCVQVFFQQGHSRSLQSLERVFVPLGEILRGQYVCYLPGDIPVSIGESLQVGNHCYRICRVEAMAFPKGKILYQWALCAGKGGEIT